MEHYGPVMLAGRYEVLKKIGAGGMANVYKARDTKLDRYVAIKILREEYKSEAEFLERFRTEARAVALLSHPNIVGVYDVGTENGLPFLVMELIDGITLKQYIEQKGVLTDKEIVHFTLQILRAMEHAHAKKIIHRDIKPQNILLLRDGTIKVTDFGIARFTLANTKTVTDTAIGSVHYISPEQAKGSVVDQRTDIYSLGVMMYEMLTGRLPFEGDNPVAVAIMHLRGEFSEPHEIKPDVTPGLEQIALKAMCREPSLRYQTAGEMLMDLERFKRNPSITFSHQTSYDDNQGTMHFQVPRNEVRRAYEDHATQRPQPVRQERDRYEEEEYQPRQQRPAQRTPHYSQQRPQQRSQQRPSQRPQQRPPQRRYEEEEEQGTDRMLPVKIAGIIIGIALIIAMGVFAIPKLMNATPSGNTSTSQETTEPSNSTSVQQIKIPSFTGQKYDAVSSNTTQYQNYQFQIVEQREDNSDAGTILEQDPVSGTMVDEPAEGEKIVIKLVVSSGKGTTKVPDLTNKNEADVTSALATAGLTLNKKEEYSDTVLAGLFVRCSPGIGTEVTKGSAVTVYFSLGPEEKEEQIEVPKLTDIMQSRAEGTIVGAGLSIGKVTTEESDHEKGYVLSQDPAAGTMVEPGTSVNLVVSRGPAEKPEVTVPYTINLPSEPETFELTVTCGKGDQFSGTVSASERTKVVQLTGSGTMDVDIYINGELYKSEKFTFN